MLLLSAWIVVGGASKLAVVRNFATDAEAYTFLGPLGLGFRVRVLVSSCDVVSRFYSE